MSEEQAAPGKDREGSPRTPAGIADERFAANIREHRERAGMSQADLAKAMAAARWHWYPQTVHRVEAGTRKVSVGEAKSLAEILGTTMEWLTWPGREASSAVLLSDTTARAYTAHEQVSEWARSLIHAAWQLGITVSEVEAAGYYGSEEIRKMAGQAREAMRLTPEDATAAGRAEFMRLHPELEARDERG